jgi:hypothetical protein
MIPPMTTPIAVAIVLVKAWVDVAVATCSWGVSFCMAMIGGVKRSPHPIAPMISKTIIFARDVVPLKLI